MMASILRTYKYINSFSGYYLKIYQSNYSHLKCISKSNDASLYPNRNYTTAAVVKFIDRKPEFDPGNCMEIIKERYFRSRASIYNELDVLLKSFQNENTSIIPSSTGLMLEKNIKMLIDCCGKTMKSEMPCERSKLLNTLWEIFKTTGLPLNIHHYNALLCAYLENDQDFSPAKILLEMNQTNIQPNELTYEYLIAHYCHKGNIQEANKILNFLKESEMPISENIFDVLIIGNAEADDMHGALNILNIMKIMGHKPSSKTYAALLVAYAKKGDMDNIFKTLKICKNKDIIILDAFKMDIVYTLALKGYEEHVDEILSTFSYDKSFHAGNKNFISKLMNVKKVDVAIKVLLTAKKVGVPENQLIAMAQSFSKNIIKLDLSEEKMIESINLLEKKGFNIYEDSLHNCFGRKISKYTFPLLRAWRNIGFEAKESIFWPLLANYGSENVQGTLETLQLMKTEFSIKPSLITLTRFVLPYIQNVESSDIMKTLIHECDVPADFTANATLYYLLSQYKINRALKFVENAAKYNINYNEKLLSPLLEEAFEKTNDITSCDIIKSRIQGRQEIKDKTETRTQQGFYLLPILNIINIGFKIKECSQKGDLNSAKHLIKRLKLHNRCMLPLDKLLSYFDLLVKNGKIPDALQLLQDFSSEESCTVLFNKQTIAQCTSSLNLLAERGIVDGVNQLHNFLCRKRIYPKMLHSESIVDVHLVRKNPKAALNVVKNIQKDYGFIPAKTKLMKALIEVEEVESLQWLTDLSIKHQGESVTLISLAVAFLKAQRARQCRRILESASSPLKDDLIRNVVNKFLCENNISLVKEFIQVTQGLEKINRNILFDMLLEKYSVLNDWEEGLALWMQMQNEYITPSELFLVILEELLKRNDQSVPFSVPKITSDLKEQDDFYITLTKIYLKKKLYPCKEFLDCLIDNLVNSGNTKMAELIESNWQHIYNGYLKKRFIKLKACIKSNKVDSYLQEVRESINTGNDVEIKKFLQSINHCLVNYLMSHPESMSLFESLAVQINLEKEIFKPMLVVLSYYFLKNDLRGKEFWNKSSNPLCQSPNSYSFLVQSYLITDKFDQLPKLAEQLHDCKNLNKKFFYEAFLTAYEEKNKYEEGLQVLRKFNFKLNEASREKFNDKEENNDLPAMRSQLVL